ncbi:cytidylate kinase [Rhodovibrio sodomensis]|uniref:Cytidylate kinase n=1 Tax=Rhodovibrio sodomensis TaxID=1088 RepID=A0ABS1D9V3_9PROT|nr:(d)CMP kinase [Rhodovibrio sodomensis]MBK1666761.1 cytidylate kinase [Rhodovibrio sodomensis]
MSARTSQATPRDDAIVVAVDGPAAAGKGTLARRLAAALNLVYLDTGSIYRAVAAKLLAGGGDPADADAASRVARALSSADLDRDDLRAEGVGAAASVVSAHQAVREALLEFQRAVAFDPPAGRAGAVLDGRDIGTVVCPDACAKLFVTASLEERARRRHEELLGRGEARIYARVLEDLKERDERDAARDAAPMTAAADAVVLDTSDLDVDAAFERALDIVRARCGVTAG